MGQFSEKMRKEIVIRGLSPQTQKAYLFCMKEFIKHVRKSPELVTLEDITNYQYFLKDKEKVSWSSFNQKICAIRFFYLYTLKRNWNFKFIPYTKKKRKLPTILSRNEVKCLFKLITYPKHKAMFLTLYSTGIRASELINLEILDIDKNRMLIKIREGKGSKDRYVVLSPKLLYYLREYWKSLIQKPAKWLFPGITLETKMSRKTVYSLIKKLQKRSGIDKCIYPHTLRHTFATHLLESGVDIKRIQVLLGHTSLRTTSIYCYIARDFISKVRTPLDTLDLN